MFEGVTWLFLQDVRERLKLATFRFMILSGRDVSVNLAVVATQDQCKNCPWLGVYYTLQWQHVLTLHTQWERWQSFAQSPARLI
jgi:hypothetical protein